MPHCYCYAQHYTMLFRWRVPLPSCSVSVSCSSSIMSHTQIRIMIYYLWWTWWSTFRWLATRVLWSSNILSVSIYLLLILVFTYTLFHIHCYVVSHVVVRLHLVAVFPFVCLFVVFMPFILLPSRDAFIARSVVVTGTALVGVRPTPFTCIHVHALTLWCCGMGTPFATIDPLPDITHPVLPG